MSEESSGTDTSFQSLCDELTAIIARLEAEEIPLEEAISTFERGSRIASRAQAMLEQAEQRVRLITDDAGLVDDLAEPRSDSGDP